MLLLRRGNMDRECARCGQVKDEEKFPKSFGGGYRNFCRACYARKERARLKLRMFDALGQRCNCCGETHPDFLSLDHINGDGATYRASKKERILGRKGADKRWNEQQLYRLAVREGWPKDKYQVLCMNCNFAKGHHVECPHKSGKTAEQRMAELREIAEKYKRQRGYQN